MSHAASRGDLPAEYKYEVKGAKTLPHSPRVETTSEKYARQTRNAAVTVAVIACLFAGLSIIGGIIAYNTYHHGLVCTQAQDC